MTDAANHRFDALQPVVQPVVSCIRSLSGRGFRNKVGGGGNVSLSTTSAAIARTHELHAGDAGSNKSVFSLVNSAVNTSLPAFAAERRAAAQLLPGARRSPLSIDTSCTHVGRSAANSIGARRYWRSSDGTGTDGSARDRCTEPAPLTGRSVLVTCTGENVGRPVGPYTSDASAHAAAGHRKTSSVDRSRRRVQNVQSRRR